MTSVHPSAVVDPEATLHHDVTVGPFCVVGAGVELGPGTRLRSHVTIEGPTRLGARNDVHPFAVLGGDPQHRDFQGERTRLEVGNDNLLREHVTVHRGTKAGGGVTRIGDRCLLMVGAHVGHDTTLGDHVTLTNGTLLGGHVEIGDWVVTAGHVAVAPFVRVGTSAFLAGNAMVERDVAPFVIAAGDRATVRAINRVGLARRDVPEPSRVAIKQAFHRVFAREGCAFDPAGPEADAMAQDPFVALLVAFLRAPSRMGLMVRRRTTV